jgi:hypothetical protein
MQLAETMDIDGRGEVNVDYTQGFGSFDFFPYNPEGLPRHVETQILELSTVNEEKRYGKLSYRIHCDARLNHGSQSNKIGKY